CTAAAHAGDSWLGYHILMAAWTMAAAVTLASGFMLSRRRILLDVPPDTSAPATFPVNALHGWVTAMALLVLGLACRSVALDPGGAAWSAAAVLAVSTLAAGLAVWRRQEGWALAGCLLINVAVSFLVCDV